MVVLIWSSAQLLNCACIGCSSSARRAALVVCLGDMTAYLAVEAGDVKGKG